MTDTLLATWTTPFELPPFAEIADEDFEPAIETAMAEAKSRIAEIADSGEAASFENTIAALERADRTLGRVGAVFWNRVSTDSTEPLRAAQLRLAPKFAAHRTEITMNTALFARIDAVHAARETLGAEERRVTELYHRDFVRAGAKLTGEDRAKYAEVAGRLAELGTQFGQNILADEREWAMDLAPDDLEGLPDFVVSSAAAAAKERGRDGHVITLSRSLIVPFLQFSPRRDLRQKAYEAWVTRGANGGETDNIAIVTETLALRETRARLLGYEDFAHFKLAPEMAKTPEAVRRLLMQVWAPARAKAMADAQHLQDMMAEDGINDTLEAWDWRYYAARRQKTEHALDEAELKPYLQLDNILAAAFDVAGRLFDLSFTPVDVPLPHPEAQAFEVKKGDRHMGVFIGDYFNRPGKNSGAWCSGFRRQSRFDGDVRPVVINVCNFAKPAPGEPALLTFDDARTLFHEMGHALHGLLSDVAYPRISGTAVARDFVELPSQLYEHWLSVPEILTAHARHAVTGEAMPDDLLARLRSAENADQGFATVEYTASALVDLELHTGPATPDPMARQTEILAEIGMPHAIRMRHATPHFAHVFAGDGYSSGYYSYLWSEVMDADAFAAFEEAGDPFDASLAELLETHVYSAGGRAEADALYRAFRGALPDAAAMLKGRGFEAA
ncbi:MAG: M3 family metallopeptidase [Pseudomonadota bacterium]